MDHIKTPRGPQRDAAVIFRIAYGVEGLQLAMDDPVILESVFNDEIGFLEPLFHVAFSDPVMGMDVGTWKIVTQIAIKGTVVPGKIGVKDNGTIRFHSLLRIKEGRQLLIFNFNPFQSFFSSLQGIRSDNCNGVSYKSHPFVTEHMPVIQHPAGSVLGSILAR
jgi:hypothetical protein